MWSRKYQLKACRECGTDERPHYAFGLCGRCYRRQYYRNNPEKCAAWSRTWLEKNPDKARKYSRQYMRRAREKDPEACNAKHKKWRDENPYAWYASRGAYRARKAGAQGHATAEQVKARVEYYGGLCYLCGEKAFGIEHVTPMSRGGTNWPANLRPICKSCQSSKKHRTLKEYLAGVSVPHGAGKERYSA